MGNALLARTLFLKDDRMHEFRVSLVRLGVDRGTKMNYFDEKHQVTRYHDVDILQQGLLNKIEHYAYAMHQNGSLDKIFITLQHYLNVQSTLEETFETCLLESKWVDAQ
jgi:hypothetical protein